MQQYGANPLIAKSFSVIPYSVLPPSCIYCQAGIGSTRDHVPPRGFFQEPIPSDAQLITVPCCEPCRKRDHANDELVRNILVSLEDVEPLDYVSKHVIPRRDRAIKRSEGQIRKMAELLLPVVVKNENGKVVRQEMAFSLDHPSITQFLERVGRALLFNELGSEFFEAKFDWRLNPPIPPEIYQFAVANFPKRMVLDVVAYTVSPLLGEAHWVIVQFYGRLEFLLRYEKLAKDYKRPPV